MSKKSETGSIILVLLLLLLFVGVIAAYFVYKVVNTGTQKIAQNSEALKVALKSEYQNPFDEKTSYDNPFNDYHNPFDQLK